MNMVAPLLFSLAVQLVYSREVEFTLFEDRNHLCCSWFCGTCQKFSVETKGCLTLNFYNDKVSSIDTQGNCVRVWEDQYCKGRSLELQPWSPHHDSLSRISLKGKYSWNDEIGSVSGCEYNGDVPESVVSSKEPPCVPTDRWVTVSKCVNKKSKSPLVCQYAKKQGVTMLHSKKLEQQNSKTDSTSITAGVGLELKVLSAKFETTLGTSSTTGNNWADENSHTWNEETESSQTYTVEPHSTSYLRQIVGQCGDFLVYSSTIEKIDEDKK